MKHGPPGLPGPSSNMKDRRTLHPRLLLLFLALLFSPPLAQAYDYQRTLGVQSEDDIRELFSNGDLAEDEAKQLLSMFNEKLDLNRASAEELYALPGVTIELSRSIVTYRDDKGYFQSLEEVLEVPGFDEELLKEIRPFARVRWRIDLKVPVGGKIDGKFAWSYEDVETTPLEEAEPGKSYRASELGLKTLPEGYIRFRGDVASRLQLGLVTTGGEGIDSFVLDEANQVFQADWGRPLFTLRKIYLRSDGKNWEAIAGSYQIGFGQKLTFNESGRYRPKGFYPDAEVSSGSNFPASDYSFSYPQRLFGVAGTYQGLNIGSGNLELTGFFSRRAYDFGQYYFILDGRVANDSSNVVLLGPTKIYGVTLPNVFQEQIIGSHATFRLDKKTYIGATGYYSKVYKDFPFSFKSGMPINRDGFGAVGLDFGAALWRFQLNGEYSLMDNKAQAFVLQSILGLKKAEILASVRAYGRDFDNPHSSGFSESDVLNRERDRDEEGFYFKVNYRIARWLEARASYNQWYRPTLEVWRNDIQAKLSFMPTRKSKIEPWFRWRDKNLAKEGRSRNYETTGSSSSDTTDLSDDSADGTYDGASIDTSDGVKTQYGLRIKVRDIKRLRIEASYKRTYMDANYEYYTRDCLTEYDWQFGHDVWLKISYELPWGTNLLTRVRYLDEDRFGSKDDRAYQVYLQAQDQLAGIKFRLRYAFTQKLGGHVLEVNEFCENREDQACSITADTVEEDSEIIIPSHTMWLSFEKQF